MFRVEVNSCHVIVSINCRIAYFTFKNILSVICIKNEVVSTTLLRNFTLDNVNLNILFFKGKPKKIIKELPIDFT